MTKTKYLPAEWLDEIVPPPVDHPDDLIRVVSGKSYLLAAEVEEDGDTWKTEIQDGTFVDFCEFRDHGNWAITIDAERDPATGGLVWRGGENIDEEANCFHFDDGYYEAFGGTLAEMVAALVEDNPSAAGTYSVHAYHWSEAKPWYFAVRDGQCCFTKAEVIH